MSAPLTPHETEYGRKVRERARLICEWLGMSPEAVIRLIDEKPNRYGEVEINWESMALERPSRGALVQVGARGSYDEPTRHSGRLMLRPDDAAAMLEVAGPKPELFTPEDRARLAEAFPGHPDLRT